MSLSLDDLRKLKEPFPDDVLSVKVQSFSRDKTKAMLVLYLQHTDVANRLDEVDPSWEFTCVQNQREGDTFIVHGLLTLKGVGRQNAGEGDSPKAAYSDALKRCAMLFGVGRQLYDSELVWVPYNENQDKYKQWGIDEYRKQCRQPLVQSRMNPSALPKGSEVKDRAEANGKDPGREALNKSILGLYGPFMKAKEGFAMATYLKGKYGVSETRLMTQEQLTDLVRFMEGELKHVK